MPQVGQKFVGSLMYLRAPVAIGFFCMWAAGYAALPQWRCAQLFAASMGRDNIGPQFYGIAFGHAHLLAFRKMGCAVCPAVG